MKTEIVKSLILFAALFDATCGAQTNGFYANGLIGTNTEVVAVPIYISYPVCALHLDAATNWTGLMSGTNELGYVVTNHNLHVYYMGATNQFCLRTDNSTVAVWKPVYIPGVPTWPMPRAERFLNATN